MLWYHKEQGPRLDRSQMKLQSLTHLRQCTQAKTRAHTHTHMPLWQTQEPVHELHYIWKSLYLQCSWMSKTTCSCVPSHLFSKLLSRLLLPPPLLSHVIHQLPTPSKVHHHSLREPSHFSCPLLSSSGPSTALRHPPSIWWFHFFFPGCPLHLSYQKDS